MASNISGIGNVKVGEQRLPGNARPDSNVAAPTSHATAEESVRLSDEASKIIKIESKLKNTPEIDEARVERIRQAVANGQYHIDPRRVAVKFLEVEGHLSAG